MKKFLMAVAAMVLIGSAVTAQMPAGAAPMPKKLQVRSQKLTLGTNMQFTGTIGFNAGEDGVIAVISESLDLYVYDANGLLVGKVTGAQAKKAVLFKVTATQKYKVVVVNTSKLPISFDLGWAWR